NAPWVKKSAPPSAFSDATLMWDSIHQRMIVYGADYPASDELWTYDSATDVWTELHPTPDPVYGSPPVGAPHAAFDTTHGVLLLLGRSDSPYIPTWTYNAVTNAWKKMNPPTEPGDSVQNGSRLVYDPVNNVFFLVSTGSTSGVITGLWRSYGEL